MPVVTPPADVTTEATGAQTTESIGTATAVDLVDGPLGVSNDAPDVFSLGTTVVTWDGNRCSWQYRYSNSKRKP